jgi:hypothetical protein
MCSRVVYSCPRFLLLVVLLTLFCRDYALGSESRKGPKPSRNPASTVTTQEPCDTTVETLYAATAVAYYWR